MYKSCEKTGDKASSKGLSDEKIISTTTSTDKSATKTIYDNARINVGFNGDLLRQNIYIVYETTPDTKTSNITFRKLSIWCN